MPRIPRGGLDDIIGVAGNAVVFDDDGVGVKDAGVTPGAGSVADGSITNAKLANVVTATLKGRSAAGTGAPSDLTAATVRALLNVEDGATADQTGAEIVSAINAQLGGATWQSGGGGGGADLVGTGFGTDQRAAIQAKLDALLATGGWVELEGDFRVDGSLTTPANAASATGEATFGLKGDYRLKAGGTQNFHIIDWSGYGIAQKLNFEIRNGRLIGLWEEQADGTAKANGSYRGINVDYANRVSVENCWVDNARGFSISIDKCTEGHVAGCTVTRSGKDGISVNNCVVTRVINNTVYGCGDNGIAAHAGVLTTGTIANSAGTIQTTSGSPTVSITFPSSNNAVVGDKLVITSSAVVGGLNLRGTWTIATKADGTHCTFTHDLNATATVGAGDAPGVAPDFEIGIGWEESRQSVQIIGNSVEQSFGIKVNGGPNVDISHNILKTIHGPAIYVGGNGSGGEGMIDFRSLTIDWNQITDVVKKAYHDSVMALYGSSTNLPVDACIYVDHRWFNVHQARIENNTLNCSRQKGSTTVPSQWERGYTPPNGGPASPEHRWFFAVGWHDVAFSGEPVYGVIRGIEIRCKNALDRSAIRVKNNSFLGLVANQAVRRYAPINGGTRVRPTIANASIASWETALSGSYVLSALDLAPAYGVGIRARKGATGGTQPTVTLECRLRKNDGIGVDGYVETSWLSGTAFATAQATLSSDNNDQTTAITALPADAKRSMDVVPYGATSVNGNPFELISLELIVDHADNDSDYVVPTAQQIYDPTSVGVTLGFGVVPAATWASMTSGEKAGRAWVVV